MNLKKGVRSIAEQMYIEQNMTAKAISETLHISEVSLSKWKKEGNWEQRRNELLSAPHKLRELLLNQLKNVAQGEELTINADALAKISKVIESLSDKVSPQAVFSVFKEFDNWMSQQDPQKATEITEFHKQFLLYKIRDSSPL